MIRGPDVHGERREATDAGRAGDCCSITRRNASTISGSNWRDALALDFGDRLGDRPRRLVGPLLGERVEHVGDRDDAAGERNLVLPDAA